jgi:diguanylate cyclase (GGDEF)-like protein
VARILGSAPAPQLVPQTATTYPSFLAAKLPGYMRDLNELQSRLRQTLNVGVEGIDKTPDDDALTYSFQVLGLRLTHLLELNLTLSSQRDVEEMLHQFCQLAQSAMLCRYVAIGLCSADGKQVLHLAACGLDAGCRTLLAQIDASQGLIGEVMNSGKAIRLRDNNAQPTTLGLPDFHPPLKSLLTVAIPGRSATLVKGWIYFADKNGEAAFDSEDEQFAAILASQLSLAYGNLAMYGEIQKHAMNLELEVAERRRAQESLAHQMTHDHITGLPRLGPAEERLHAALARAAAENGRIIVLHLNIDRFQMINESHGRATGDDVLRVIAGRLCDLVREQGWVAHVAGDEFVIVLPDSGTRDQQEFAETVRRSLEEPTAHEVSPIYLTCSIGTSCYPDNSREALELLREAETAMRRAKREGRNTIRAFSNEEKNGLIEKRALGTQLRNAIRDGQLIVQYQPQIRGQDWQILGFEALLRWQHPEFGLLSPARFIPISEELGLIVELGNFVVETACRQSRAWLDSGAGDFIISINVSSLQIQRPDFVEGIKARLAQFNVPARCLEIELTESMLAERADLVANAMNALKAIGVGIALDDFGTGFSSLNYLRRFPLDRLKIDQSFVRDIAVDASSAGICRAIIGLGHQLGMNVMAEGVETAAQVGYLLRNGCDAFQGYYFSQAVAPAQALELLRQRYMNQHAVVQSRDERTLLLVDDEENILRALTRTLRRDGYHIFTATAAREAFELLARHDIQVIISDQRMPGMSGTEFLSRVKEMYPGTVRMVLSGYTDLQAVTDAINRGAIYKFLTKPWNDADLRAQILEAFRLYQSQHEARASR